jgi:hypothetical protein
MHTHSVTEDKDNVMTGYFRILDKKDYSGCWRERVCVRALGTVNQSKAGDAEKRKAGHSCLPVTLVVPHINQDNVSSGEHR